MKIVDSPYKYCTDIVNNFNKKSKKYQTKMNGLLTKNMSMYCETIQIKEKKFFGKRLHIDYWHNENFFEVELYQDEVNYYKPLIQEFEKITKRKIQVTLVYHRT